MPSSPPSQVLELIERFDRYQDVYRGKQYNETQVRIDFINPLFVALGWDVENKKGAPEAYKDVIHEAVVRVGGATKAPDYSFNIGGERKFFLEAKRPSVNLKDDINPAFQLRRYAWSATLRLSILTDFEELVVYDCRVEPFKTDKSTTARALYIPYTDYDKRWDEIVSIFSREAVLNGGLDKFIEAVKIQKGTTTVDVVFLKEIETWRDLLARSLALRNPHLSQRELNFAVQITIDRIIFLRMCEDRGIEEYGRLQSLQNGRNTYDRLVQWFRQADDRYNSGLFHFRKEKGRPEEPDDLTLSLAIDDTPLQSIIKNLYYPDSPYEFSVLPIEILGHVYEQFLGKVIRLTEQHQAVVEEKPEVRKAGGVFYTPTYIVDYIVAHTIGKLLEGKSPRQVAGTAKTAPLRIVDPACGSGSFLIGAYQYLLDWYRDRYVEEGADKHKKEIYQGRGGEWRLTTAERKRILTSHIYGVDIDTQAVEVTKLSLLLKVLEGENNETLTRQLSLFQERALPDLADNVKCGNSLISSEFYQGQQMGLLDQEETLRVNIFDWHAEFPYVFKGQDKGFDGVIGNPPYIRVQALNEWAPLEVEFYKRYYRAASKGNYDIYVVFVERSLSLLNREGRLGFILPHKFFNAKYGEPLRYILATGHHVAEIVHFGDQQVFLSATTYTTLLFLDKRGINEIKITKAIDLDEWRRSGEGVRGTIPATSITGSEWNFNIGEEAGLFARVAVMPTKLGDIAHLFVGLQTDADDVYIVEEVRRENGLILCRSKATGQEHWFEDDHLKPFLKGSLNIRRYYLSDVTKRLIFPYEMIDAKSVLIGEQQYQNSYPLTWAYLVQNRERLSARNKGRMGHEWYGYVYKKNHTRFDLPKLLVPSIATGSTFAADLEGKYYFVGSGGGGGGGYAITLSETGREFYMYLLGVLNSHLLSEYLKTVSTPFRGGYIALNRQYIEQLPIPKIDATDRIELARRDGIARLAEQMLASYKKLRAARTGHERTILQRQIDATDQQLDQLVYELYGLSEEEIMIIEGQK